MWVRPGWLCSQTSLTTLVNSRAKGSALDAQRTADAARGRRIRAANLLLQNRIDLYLALGGDFADASNRVGVSPVVGRTEPTASARLGDNAELLR